MHTDYRFTRAAHKRYILRTGHRCIRTGCIRADAFAREYSRGCVIPSHPHFEDRPFACEYNRNPNARAQ